MKGGIKTLFLLFAIAVAAVSCEDIFDRSSSELNVSTVPVAEIRSTMAIGGGIVRASSDAGVLARGVCWSTHEKPVVALSSKTSDSTGRGRFSSSLTGLIPNTKYYVRAYVTSVEGTIYGSEVSFESSPASIPEIVTLGADSITSFSVRVRAKLITDGGITLKDAGVYWSESPGPAVSMPGKISAAPVDGIINVKITTLRANKTYYLRTYAVNNVGPSYGKEISINTSFGTTPSVETVKANNISSCSAEVEGRVVNDGGLSLLSRGVCWSLLPDPVANSTTKVQSGNGIGSYTGKLSSLAPNTTYYLRAYAVNKAGISYGKQISIRTKNL